jgi:hypothetical protein
VLPRRRPVPSGLTPAGLMVAGLAVAVLAGCGGSGPATPAAAPQATSAGCRQALAVLPATVLGRARTPLDVAGAASWGEPGIVLRCGLAEQPPTGKPCLTVDGVDWVVDDTGDPIVFTAYGRTPTVDLRVPLSYHREDAAGALVDVAAVARALPGTGHACIG